MNPITKLLGAAVNRFANIGLGQLPGVLTVYRFVWRYFGPKGIKMAEVDGFKLFVICRDWAVAPTMLFAHSWEPAETAIFKKYIKYGDTVIDAGAYIGFYTVLSSKLVGDGGKVYSFEPSPDNAGILIKNIKLNNCNNIRIIRKAVSDKIGTVTFYPNPCNASGSTMFENYSTSQKTHDPKVEVDTISLDKVIGDGKVDFVKMDIEGGETKALKGMVNIINNSPNLKMIVEVFPIGLKNVGSSLEEFVESLQQYFKLYIVGGDESMDVGLEEVQQEIKKSAVINLFCVRKDVIS
jgi:FkbM family methyltransferase